MKSTSAIIDCFAGVSGSAARRRLALSSPPGARADEKSISDVAGAE